jgi:glycosyltransferase involved in cell wall biosynthesis
VPPGDAASLAAALRQALAGGPDIEAVRQSAFKRAAEHSMAALARRYLQLYEPLLSR